MEPYAWLFSIITDINFLKLGFSLLTLVMVVAGGLMNSIEMYLPVYFTQSFRYGKFAYKGTPPALKPIEVPKRWFRHFYVFASVLSSAALAFSFYIYFLSGASPQWITFLLDILATRKRQPCFSAATSFLAITLFTIQSWHRFYETHYISVFSNSRINLSHYIVGYCHYFGCIAAVLAESPVFARGLEYGAIFRISDISLLQLYSSCVFLWACYHQFTSSLILAKLRKDKKGDVLSYDYAIPNGDWFEYVSSPHLLAEIIMYLSLTIILWGAHIWPFVFLWVLSNQIESALLTHWWYKSKFEDYPKSRKAIIPYVM